MGVIDARLPEPTAATPYGRLGDWPFGLALLTSFALCLWPVLGRISVSKSHS